MLEKIRKNLTPGVQEESDPTGLVTASVLLPLLYKEDTLHVLLTKRTRTVKTHKGQVSFPGGVRDADDHNLLATALREAQEEIHLRPQDVEIFGALEPISTITTGYLVYTFVGLIPYPYPFKPNSREVAEILTVPLHFLADARHWSRSVLSINNRTWTTYSVTYGNQLIWGATARILKSFLERNGIEFNVLSLEES
ncbi:MAG: NUDIX hydrolase [Syntrophobacteria bacterium]